MSRPATFRPRLGGFVFGSCVVLLAVYGLLKWVDWGVVFVATYPLGLAGLVAVAHFGYRVATRWRRLGYVVDADGIMSLQTGERLPFSSIVAVKVEVATMAIGDTTRRGRCVTLEGPGARLFQFADLGPGVVSREGIANLNGAGLLLAAVAVGTKSQALFPESWNAESRESGVPPTPPPMPPAPPTVSLGERLRAIRPWGVFALVMKLGPKALTIALKLAKTVKPGAALITVVAYSLIFSWKFALAFVGLILVHECGHVYAMWRSGVGVKGIYFIPFLGGVAVARGRENTAGKSAYIALAGPAWGTALALLCVAVFAVGGSAWGFVAALAAWGALLNLFNLLPVMPLDGGRVLSALCASRSWGMLLVAASLLLGAAVAYLAELQLLVLMVFVGLAESGSSMRSAELRDGLRLLGGREYGASESEHFTSMVSPIRGGRNTDKAVNARAQMFESLATAARHDPLPPKLIVLTLAVYVGLCGTLIGLMFALRDLPGGGDPWALLT